MYSYQLLYRLVHSYDMYTLTCYPVAIISIVKNGYALNASSCLFHGTSEAACDALIEQSKRDLAKEFGARAAFRMCGGAPPPAPTMDYIASVEL